MLVPVPMQETAPVLVGRAKQVRMVQHRIRAQTALDFDFFTALTDEADEVTHSRFIAALLNPHGRHGQGAIFLQSFLCEISLLTDTLPIDAESWWVKTEFPLDHHGRIDILICGPDHVIGIENKVGASEGDDQLPRYKQGLEYKFRGKESHLVFLTPTGRGSSADDSCPNIRCSYARSVPLPEGELNAQTTGQTNRRSRIWPPGWRHVLRSALWSHDCGKCWRNTSMSSTGSGEARCP